jgi:hypothetical protein
MWCIPKVTEEFLRRMYDVLEILNRPYNPQQPVLCMDEKSKQLLKEIRLPIHDKKGVRYDYEYERNGTVNLFMVVEPKGGKRSVRVTRRRTKKRTAYLIRYLVMTRYKDAGKVIIIADNLNTHTNQILTDTFGKEEGERIAGRIERHYTPKHASWLDPAEIEIHVLERQCLKRRIGEFQKLQHEVACWERQRNKKQAGIQWTFTKERAEQKFGTVEDYFKSNRMKN